MHRSSWRLAAVCALVAATACRPDFNLKGFTTSEALYQASLAQYKAKHWDNAVTGFEKLTTDLPARDSLLPRSYWYLASAHEHLGEHLLAAQSFNRLVESFPDDSLADDAALEAARSYRRLWRKPQLDPTYGETALSSYQTLIGLYPTSPLIPTAQKEIAELDDWFAKKDYNTGMYYFREKAYDSGVIYFKDVLSKYATTPTARLAGLRLVETYKAIHYTGDAQDMCASLEQAYPKDGEVDRTCAGVARPPATAPPAPAAKPDTSTPSQSRPPGR